MIINPIAMHPNQSYRYQDTDYKQKVHCKCLLTEKLFNFYGENWLWFFPIHLHIFLIKINKNLTVDQKERSIYKFWLTWRKKGFKSWLFFRNWKVSQRSHSKFKCVSVYIAKLPYPYKESLGPNKTFISS